MFNDGQLAQPGVGSLKAVAGATQTTLSAFAGMNRASARTASDRKPVGGRGEVAPDGPLPDGRSGRGQEAAANQRNALTAARTQAGPLGRWAAGPLG